MLLLTEKDLVRPLENEFHFDSDRENNHRHDKGNENSFARVSAFVFLLNLSNRNEQLFHVVLVERQRINVAEDAPVCQMANQTDELGGVPLGNLCFGQRNVAIGQVWLWAFEIVLFGLFVEIFILFGILLIFRTIWGLINDFI